MMDQSKIDAIRRMHPREIYRYFERLSADASDISNNSNTLTELVNTEALPPHVYSLWLQNACRKDISLLIQAISSPISRSIRKGAIKWFAKRLRGADWISTWDAAGNVPGVVRLLAVLSADHVEVFVRGLGTAFGKLSSRSRSREIEMEKLLTALLPLIFAADPVTTKDDGLLASITANDDRPLAKIYLVLLSACGEEYVRHFLLSPIAHEVRHQLPMKQLRIKHRALFQQELVADPNKWPFSDYWWYIVPELHSRHATIKFESVESMYIVQLLKKYPDKLGVLLPELLKARYFSKKVTERLVYIVELCLYLLGMASQKSLKDAEAHAEDYLNAAAVFWSKVHRHQDPSEDLKRLADKFVHVVSELFRPNDLMDDLKLAVGQYPALERYAYLRAPPRRLRYGFLRKLFLLCRPHPLDLDDLRTLPQGKDALMFSIETFRIFDKKKAIGLYGRLLGASSDFLVTSSSSRNVWVTNSTSPEQNAVLLWFLLHYMERGTEKALQSAAKHVAEYQRNAITSRDQETRAYWACAALRCSVVSYSIRLYDDTVTWSQRYIRDPLTWKEIYASKKSVFGTAELSVVLSGLPENASVLISPAELGENITIANGTIRKHFENARLSLQEASFNPHDWSGLPRAVGDAILRRLVELNKRRLHEDFHQLAEAVLESTLELVIEIESLSLQSGHEKLDFQRSESFFNFANCSTLSDGPLADEVCQFLDNLVYRRDQLWREVRIQRNPDVISLPPIWPQGLPVQCLLNGLVIKCENTERRMPYFSSRLKNIWDISHETAFSLPGIAEEKHAIGRFINDYNYVLRCHVAKGRKDRADIRLRLAHCYERCLQLMTPDFSTYKQRLGWYDVLFKIVGSDKKDLLPPMTAQMLPEKPVIPAVDDLDMPVEWTPFQPISKAADTLRVIDTMLLTYPTNTNRLQSEFPPDATSKHLRTASTGTTYNLYRYTRYADAQNREAIILCAFLYLDAKSKNHERFLQKPWPSSDKIRYPMVFLDDDFLSQTMSERDNGENMIQQSLKVLILYSSFVPSGLLERLLSRLLQRLQLIKPKSAEFPNLQTLVFRILQLLAQSDRPERAISTITNTIVHNSGASSWHRQLLSVKFCKRLLSSDVSGFMHALVQGMAQQLELQQQQQQQKTRLPKEKIASPPGNPTASVIKITTAKMITRLIVTGGFLGSQATFAYLQHILRLSGHIDVIATTVESLLGLLHTSAQDPKAVDLILSALEVVVPRIGGVNERKLTTEEEWLRAEAGGELPLVTLERDADANAPLAKLISVASVVNIPERYKEAYVRRILVPAVDASVQTHKRWIRAFLKQQAPDILIPEVLEERPLRRQLLAGTSAGPGRGRTGGLLRDFTRYAPRRMLKLEQNTAVITTAIGRFRLVTEMATSAGAAVRPTNSNAHARWLEIINDRWSSCLPDIYSIPSSVLLGGHGIDKADVLKMVYEIFRAFLEDKDSKGETYLRRLENALTNIRNMPSLGVSDAQLEVWQSNIKHITERAINDIEEMRTPAWNRDPNRWPAHLPDTYSRRLSLLLPYPTLPYLRNQPDRYDEFVGAVLHELISILAENKLYVKKVQQLTQAVLRLPSNQYLKIAQRMDPIGGLGSVDVRKELLQQMTTLQLLRCEMCAELLKKYAKPHESAQEAVCIKSILAAWRVSPTEEVRVLAFETKQALKHKGWSLSKSEN